MKSKKICLVTSDFMGIIPNGGVGTSVAELALTLVETNFEVEVLFANESTYQDECFHWWQAYYLTLGIKIISLPNIKLMIDQGISKIKVSYVVYEYLKNTDYDTIIFPEMHGTSYYSSIAKKAGLCFKNTELIVMFHGPTLWHVHYNAGLPSGISELVIDYIEKKSIEMADKVYFATNHARDVALKHEFITPEHDSEVLLYPFNLQNNFRIPKYNKIDSIVFFGRIERRKGIIEFLEALGKIKEFIIKNGIAIHILGNYGFIKGTHGKDLINDWMDEHKIPLYLVLDKNREEALKYLSKLKPLVVLPSREETMGYTLIECLTLNASVVCSDIPAYKDVLQDLNENNVDMFEVSNLESIVKVILANLKNPKQSSITKTQHQKVSQAWQNAFAPASLKKNNIKSNHSSEIQFSLCILTYRRPLFLSQIIDQLSRISTIGLEEILIYDDFSNDELTLEYLKQIPTSVKNIPVKILYSDANRGPSYGRNLLGSEATGTHLIFLDDDNLLAGNAFEIWHKCIEHTGKEIFVSLMLQFDESMLRKPKIWLPVGNDLGINVFYNFIGDANFCIQREAFLSIGGFEEDLRGREDQEFLVRATSHGLTYQIIPELMIKYRLHEDNLSTKENNELNLFHFHKLLTQSVYHKDMLNMIQLMRAWGIAYGNIIDTDNVAFNVINPLRTNFFEIKLSDKNLEKELTDIFDLPQHQIQNAVFLHVPNSKNEIIYDANAIANAKVKKVNRTIKGNYYRVTIHVPMKCIVQFDESQIMSLKLGINSVMLFQKAGQKFRPEVNERGISFLVTEICEA